MCDKLVNTTTMSPIASIISGLSSLSNALASSPASSWSLTYWVWLLPFSYIFLVAAQFLIKSKIALPEIGNLFGSVVPGLNLVICFCKLSKLLISVNAS